MRPVLCLAIVCVLALAGAGMAHAAGAYSQSAFEKVMGDTMKDLRLLLNSLVAEDWAKAQSSAQDMTTQAKAMRDLTPKVSVDRIGEFQAQADSLAARGARVLVAVKAHDRGLATAGMGRMVETCMTCHSIFRK